MIYVQTGIFRNNYLSFCFYETYVIYSYVHTIHFTILFLYMEFLNMSATSGFHPFITSLIGNLARRTRTLHEPPSFQQCFNQCTALNCKLLSYRLMTNKVNGIFNILCYIIRNNLRYVQL